MKKKIIFLAFCLIVFLIFTALGYAWGPNPKERIKGHPWEHALSSKPDDDRNLNFVVLAINPHVYLIFKSPIKVENSNSLGKFLDQKSASPMTQSSLNKNETMSKK